VARVQNEKAAQSQTLEYDGSKGKSNTDMGDGEAMLCESAKSPGV